MKSNNRVPRWRLAREGPFPNERSQASLRVLGKGCLFRHTSYEWEDHALPKGGLGVPLNHPRFLEWLGTPDTAWLLEMSPGHWCDVIQRPGVNGGNATTQGRLSYAIKLGHSRPVRPGVARNGIDHIATNNWLRLFSGYGGTDGGPRGTGTQSLGTNGGAWTLETYVGPFTVCGGTILNVSCMRHATVS